MGGDSRGAELELDSTDEMLVVVAGGTLSELAGEAGRPAFDPVRSRLEGGTLVTLPPEEEEEA